MTAEDSHRLLALAAPHLTRDEMELLLGHVDAALGAAAATPNTAGGALLRQVQTGAHGSAFNALALQLSRNCRELSAANAVERPRLVRSLLNARECLLAGISGQRSADIPTRDAVAPAEEPVSLEAAITQVYLTTVGRSPVEEEIEIWRSNFTNGLPFHEFLLLMGRGPEAKRHGAQLAVLPSLSDGECVQRAFEIVLGRGASAWEIEHWLGRLEDGSITRSEMLASLFATAVDFFGDSRIATHDGLSALIMGTGRHVSATEWEAQAERLAASPPRDPDLRHTHRFNVGGEPRFLVSALASLYRGGEFIEQFMDNICSQDGFDDYCELVIIDADSPEDEYETIRRYLARHRNINYVRCNYRIGIYDAWNVAARAARGEYLTNTNLDDLRRHDSLMLQAGVLEELPFVDVVYQELYYTFDPRLSFEQISPFGHETMLPVITPHNLIAFNSPHNAPMWRRRLHEEVGYFDTRYRSAGDYEFWMRCLAADKVFYKINDPHVAYYQNPKGLSTRPDTRGVQEAMQVHKDYCRRLIPAQAVMPTTEFLRSLEPSRPPRTGGERYTIAQAALREAARRSKFPRPGGDR